MLTPHEESVIKSLISEAAKRGGNTELEARFQQPIDAHIYKKVFDHYWQTSLKRQKYVHVVVEKPHTLLNGSTQRTLARNGIAEQVQKVLLQPPLTCTRVPVKFVLSLEKEMARYDYNLDLPPHNNNVALKKRWRFQDNDIFIDLTCIVAENQQITSRQIEIELDSTKFPANATLTYKRFLYAVGTIHKIILSAWPPECTMVTLQSKDNLQNLICRYFGKKFPGVLPVSIKHQVALDNVVEDKEYAVSVKLDGKRYILLIKDGNETYIMDRSFRWASIKLALQLKDNAKTSIFFDVEIVDDVCYIFDVLIMDSNVHLPQRLQKIATFLRKCACDSLPGLIVKQKPFHLDDAEKRAFIKNFDALNDEHQDGLIFTAINRSYGHDLLDCLKWKLPEQTSIDFLLKKRTSSVMQISFSLFVRDDKNQNIPFTPSPTLTISTVDGRAGDMLMYDGAITECTWDYCKQQFTLKGIRHDKQHPNHIVIAMDAWQHILSPSSLSLLPSVLQSKQQDEDDELEHLFSIIAVSLGWHNDVYHLLDVEILMEDYKRLDRFYHISFNENVPYYSSRFSLTHRTYKTQHHFHTTYVGQFVASHLKNNEDLVVASLDFHPLLRYVRCIQFVESKIPMDLLAYDMPFETYLAWISGKQIRAPAPWRPDQPNLLQMYCDKYTVAIDDLVPICPYVPNMQYTFVPHVHSHERKRSIKAVRNQEKEVVSLKI